MALIIRSKQAKKDLKEIWKYIASDDADAATILLKRIESKLFALAQSSKLGPARDDIRPGLRYFPIDKYLLFYREIEDGIELVRVVHGARNLTALFE